MICPTCKQGKLGTVQTFNLPAATWRSKACPECDARFTTKEEVQVNPSIPQTIRDAKRSPGKRKAQHGTRQT